MLKINWESARLDPGALALAINNDAPLPRNGLLAPFAAWVYRVPGAGRLLVIARSDGIDIARYPVGDDGKVSGADVSAFLRGVGNVLKGKQL